MHKCQILIGICLLVSGFAMSQNTRDYISLNDLEQRQINNEFLTFLVNDSIPFTGDAFQFNDKLIHLKTRYEKGSVISTEYFDSLGLIQKKLFYTTTADSLLCYEFDKRGFISAKGYTYMDNRVGVWKFFEEGALIRKKVYQNPPIKK